jgi:hypothetical protein
MSSNDDSRRNRDRPEDNPFIAFRRFADSQMSSLLNTVFTLPATIANFNNAHVAREHCLFGSGDKAQCERLSELEGQIAHLRSEGRELYRRGDLQQVLEKGEAMKQLDQQAEELRRSIVAAGQGTEAGERLKLSRQWEELQQELMKEFGWTKEGDGRTNQEALLGKDGWPRNNNYAQENQSELVERVANQKGQQWGWSWDWGFPKPFDQDDNTTNDTTDSRMRCRRWRSRREDASRQQHAEEQWDAFNRELTENGQRLREGRRGNDDGSRHAEGRLFGLPPPADSQRDNQAQAERTKVHLESVFDEIGNAIAKEVPSIFRSMRYSPQALDESDEMKVARVHWLDAFEDLIRAEHGAPLIPNDHLGAYQDTSYDRWARRFYDPSFARREFSQWVTASPQHPAITPHDHPSSPNESEEPNYEYAHDHEDQHDDPPTPKAKQGKWSDNMPDTELDAYERLLGRAQVPGAATKEEQDRPSVLSTLTTTERTVAPDGTVTTKVVLKKRFADGREESSETVHTQRGQEIHTHQQDPWKAIQDVQSQPQQEQPREKAKKSSWFWSS